MTELEIKYGFPLFTKPSSTVYLGDHKKLIISDLWSFWDYVIKKHGKNRDFLSALLEQAKHFYIAAESSPVKSKPLLFYYAFLNLSKIIIGIEKNYNSSHEFRHGIAENHNGNFAHSTITIYELKNDIKNVAIELHNILDVHAFSSKQVFKVKELLAHCVGVHRAYSEIYNQKEIFFRLDNAKLYKSGRDMIFRGEVRCKADNVASLQARGYSIAYEDGKYFYECKIQTTRYSKTRADYYALSQKLRHEGIWYYIGSDGHTFYLSELATNRYSPESIIYNVMFYLGSITRYHPYMFDRIFSDKEQWLMSEFLTTQPKQFLYLATSKVLGQHVLKAYASF